MTSEPLLVAQHSPLQAAGSWITPQHSVIPTLGFLRVVYGAYSKLPNAFKAACFSSIESFPAGISKVPTILRNVAVPSSWGFTVTAKVKHKMHTFQAQWGPS